MSNTVPTTDCADCAANQCDRCVRPGGVRQAADGTQHPTCCCGRQFRLDVQPAADPDVSGLGEIGASYAVGYHDGATSERRPGQPLPHSYSAGWREGRAQLARRVLDRWEPSHTAPIDESMIVERVASMGTAKPPTPEATIVAAFDAAVNRPGTPLAEFDLTVIVDEQAPVPAALRCPSGDIEMVVRPDCAAEHLGALLHALLTAVGVLDTVSRVADWDLVAVDNDGTLLTIGGES